MIQNSFIIFWHKYIFNWTNKKNLSIFKCVSLLVINIKKIRMHLVCPFEAVSLYAYSNDTKLSYYFYSENGF